MSSPVSFNAVNPASSEVDKIPQDLDDINTSFMGLPPELLCHILGEKYLPYLVRTDIRRVCRLWSVICKNPNGVKILGEIAWWKNFKFKIPGPVPPPPDDLIEVTKALREQMKGKHDAPTCSLLLMPEGITLNLLQKMISDPAHEHRTQFHRDSPRDIFKEIGDEPIKESYWVLITNGVIEGSRIPTFAEQDLFIAEKFGDVYKIPRYLEVVLCCILNRLSLGLYLFGEQPKTFSRCEEDVEGWKLGVGNYSKHGLKVVYLKNDSSQGVAACQRFY